MSSRAGNFGFMVMDGDRIAEFVIRHVNEELLALLTVYRKPRRIIGEVYAAPKPPQVMVLERHAAKQFRLDRAVALRDRLLNEVEAGGYAAQMWDARNPCH